MIRRGRQVFARNRINLLVSAVYFFGGVALVIAAVPSGKDSQSAYIGGAVSAFTGLLGVVGTINADNRAEAARERADAAERGNACLELLAIGAALQAAWKDGSAAALIEYSEKVQDVNQLKGVNAFAKDVAARIGALQSELTRSVVLVTGRVPAEWQPKVQSYADKVREGEDATAEEEALKAAIRPGPGG
jgi:hypothetical protein